MPAGDDRGRADGTKELIALDDGHRESTESWADLLRSCQRRGMRAPVLAIGDGALGFWAAVRQGVPGHPRAAVLVPQDRQRPQRPAEVGAARREDGLAEIWNAEDQGPRRRGGEGVRGAVRREVAQRPPRRSPTTSTCSWSSTTTPPSTGSTCMTNPIESTFATVRLRQRVTKGPGSRAAEDAMAFTLIQAAQSRWRAVNAPPRALVSRSHLRARDPHRTTRLHEPRIRR